MRNFYKGLFCSLVLSFMFFFTIGFSVESKQEVNQSPDPWKIGGKIHFVEQSAGDYIGIIEINKLTREILKEFFDVKKDSCANNNAKVLIKKENGDFFVQHYEEKNRPGIGEELHATLLYTRKISPDGHETLRDICRHLFIDKTLLCTQAPTLEQVAKAYQKIVNPEWKFVISDVVFFIGKTDSVIVAKILLNGRSEILNKYGKPVSGDFLHITLVNVDSSVVSETEKINHVVTKLKEKLSGTMVKIGKRNGQVDLEFGMSGSRDRLRP